MVDHMNKGQKINRLIERSSLPSARSAGRKEDMEKRGIDQAREKGKFVAMKKKSEKAA